MGKDRLLFERERFAAEKEVREKADRIVGWSALQIDSSDSRSEKRNAKKDARSEKLQTNWTLKILSY